jgi:hypothetical protein
MGWSILVGRLATGWLLDRYFAPCVAFFLLAIASAGVILLAGARSLFARAAGTALIGFGRGGEADVTPYLICQIFRPAVFLHFVQPYLDGMRDRSSHHGQSIRFYQLVSGASHAIGSVDRGGRFTYVSPTTRSCHAGAAKRVA